MASWSVDIPVVETKPVVDTAARASAATNATKIAALEAEFTPVVAPLVINGGPRTTVLTPPAGAAGIVFDQTGTATFDEPVWLPLNWIKGVGTIPQAPIGTTAAGDFAFNNPQPAANQRGVTFNVAANAVHLGWF